MKYKHNLFIAQVLDVFIDMMSNPMLVDKAIMEREALKLGSLNHVLSIGNSSNKQVAISLSGAKKLGVVTKQGRFQNGASIMHQHQFTFDEDRLKGNPVLAGLKLTQVQQLILDSVAFSAAFQMQSAKEYALLATNLMCVEARDPELYVLLNQDFNSHFHQILMALVADCLVFDEDQLTSASLSKIKELQSEYFKRAQLERGLDIDEEGFEVPPQYLSSKPRVSDEIIMQHQFSWLSIFALELPEDEESKAEYHAKVELLTIRQQLLDISAEGKWQVGWQVSPCWLTLGEGWNDYQWLPARVSEILTIINQAFSDKSKNSYCFRQALIQVNDIVNNYQPTYWSSAPSVAFFQSQKERLSLKSALVNEVVTECSP